MIFGLPGAALAMYQVAKPEKKQAAGGLLISAALTAMLTGITEPLEFTFYFCGAVFVCGSQCFSRCGLYADAHSECGRGYDLFRRYY